MSHRGGVRKWASRCCVSIFEWFLIWNFIADGNGTFFLPQRGLKFVGKFELGRPSGREKVVPFDYLESQQYTLIKRFSLFAKLPTQKIVSYDCVKQNVTKMVQLTSKNVKYQRTNNSHQLLTNLIFTRFQTLPIKLKLDHLGKMEE